MQINDQTATQHLQLLEQLLSQGQAEQELGQSDFLELMIAQLQNQDPLDPQSNQEFVDQITQFNILNQVTSFTQSLARLEAFQATSLIGQTVQGVLESGQIGGGVVVEVVLVNDTATLVLDNGAFMPLEGVVRVLPPADDSAGSGTTT